VVIKNKNPRRRKNYMLRENAHRGKVVGDVNVGGGMLYLLGNGETNRRQTGTGIFISHHTLDNRRDMIDL